MPLSARVGEPFSLAALAWLDFTLLFFGGILQVTSGSTGPPFVAGVTSHTVSRTGQVDSVPNCFYTKRENSCGPLQVLELLLPRTLEVSANFLLTGACSLFLWGQPPRPLACLA